MSIFLKTDICLNPTGLEHPDNGESDVIRSMAVSTKEKESEVRKQIAEAQRGGETYQSMFLLGAQVTEGSHRVVAVGTTSILPVPASVGSR